MSDLLPKPVNILLVEDNEDDIILLEEAMHEARFINIIHVVRDGQEAINYLQRRPPHENAQRPGLILMDINMPKVSGFEALDIIKKDPELASIPVVILTMSEREKDIARSYARGACSFISKPVNFDKMIEVVKQFELYWTLVVQRPS